ncbi:MAG: TM2 domain-containing protein [Gemmatimonadota bacterium]|nr:TM2 domain-containing protein [Gemmatimonadota bacterium]
MTEKESPTGVTVNVTLPAHQAEQYAHVPELKSTGFAYLIWAFAGFLGAHRFYVGRPHGVTMLILLLGGLITLPFVIGLVPLLILGIWVLVDAVAIPRWVEESRAAALAPAAAPVMQSRQTVPAAAQTPALPPAPAAPTGTGSLRIQLLKAAVEKGGVLTVTEGVIATGKTFKEVEACLNRMVDSGYVDIDNRPGSGVVTYVFTELRD